MRFELYNDIKTFHSDVYEFLSKDEAKNMVFLGNLSVGLSGDDLTGWRDPMNWVMASVKCDGRVVLAALMIPDDRLQLCAYEDFSPDAISVLVNGLKSAGVTLQGVCAEHILAETFAKIYGGAYSAEYEVVKKGRIYRLEHINERVITNSKIRLAEKKDLAFLPFWWNGFFECFDPLNDTSINEYERLISTKALYILEDNGIPVSMARIDQRLGRICGIGMVYTPPYFRNQGYATAITASLTKLCLDGGYFTALTTDLSNPVSNSIYQKMGYMSVCDTLEIDFCY